MVSDDINFSFAFGEFKFYFIKLVFESTIFEIHIIAYRHTQVFTYIFILQFILLIWK